MDHKRNASIASAMSGAGSDFMSAEDDEPVTLEGSPLPLASPRAEVVRMKGAQPLKGFNKQVLTSPPPSPSPCRATSAYLPNPRTSPTAISRPRAPAPAATPIARALARARTSCWHRGLRR